MMYQYAAMFNETMTVHQFHALPLANEEFIINASWKTYGSIRFAATYCLCIYYTYNDKSLLTI